MTEEAPNAQTNPPPPLGSILHVDFLSALPTNPLVDELCRTLKGAGESILLARNSPVHQGPEVLTADKEFRSFCRYSPDFGSWLKTVHPNLVHCHGLWHHGLRQLKAKAAKASFPIVLSPHGALGRRNGRSLKLKAALLTHMLPPASRAKLGWCVFDEAEAQIVRDAGFSQPLCICPKGVLVPREHDEEIARRYWLERCPSCKDRPVALFHAKFHHQKRLLELIDLWSECAPEDWILLITGRPLEYSVEQLQRYVSVKGYEGSILVEDSFDAPPPFSLASLFLVPAIQEHGTSLIPDALVRGIPILATEELRWEQINDSDFGWCGPWKEYGSALEQVFDLGPDELRNRGKAGREWVIKAFPWDKTQQVLGDFYRSLLPY